MAFWLASCSLALIAGIFMVTLLCLETAKSVKKTIVGKLGITGM
jgi:hypothetical protein